MRKTALAALLPIAAAGPLHPMNFDEMACIGVGSKNIPTPFPSEGGCGTKTWPSTVLAGSNSWQPIAVTVRDATSNDTLASLINIGDDMSGQDFAYKMAGTPDDSSCTFGCGTEIGVDTTSIPGWATVGGAQIGGYAFFSGPTGQRAILDVYGLIETPGATGTSAGQKWPVWAQYAANASTTPATGPALKCQSVKVSNNIAISGLSCGSGAFPDIVRVVGDAGGVRVTHDDEGFVQAVGQAYGLWDSTDGDLYDVTWVPRTTTQQGTSPCLIDNGVNTTCTIYARLDTNGSYLRGMGTYVEKPQNGKAHIVTIEFEYASDNMTNGDGPIKPMTMDELKCTSVGSKNIPSPFPSEGGCGTKTWPSTVYAGPNGWQSGAVVIRDAVSNNTVGWISNIGDSSGTDFNYNLPGWATVDGAQISGWAYFSGPRQATAALDVYGLVTVPGQAGQGWPVHARYAAGNDSIQPVDPLKCVKVEVSGFVDGVAKSLMCGSAAFPTSIKLRGDAGGVVVTHGDDEQYVQAVGQSYGLWDSTDGALYDVTWVPRSTAGATPSNCAVDSSAETTCTITARLDFNGTHLRGMGTYTEKPKGQVSHIVTVYFEYAAASNTTRQQFAKAVRPTVNGRPLSRRQQHRQPRVQSKPLLGGALKPMTYDAMSCIAVGNKNIPRPFPSDGSGCGSKTWPQVLYAGSNAWQPGAVLTRDSANQTLGWISNIGDTGGQDFNYNLPGWATMDGATISGFAFFSGPTGQKAVLNIYGLIQAPGAPGLPPGQQWPVYAQYAVDSNHTAAAATPLKCTGVRASKFVGGNFSCGIAAFPDVIKVVGDDGGVRITHEDEGYVQAIGQSCGVWDSTDGACYDVTWVPIQPYGLASPDVGGHGPCIVDTDFRTTCLISTRLDFNGTHLRGIGTYVERPLNGPGNAVTIFFEYDSA